VAELQNSLTELTSQVQQLREQLAVLQMKMYVVEFLLVLLFVGGVAIFLWRRIKLYQSLKGSAFMRTSGHPDL
jgi:hypothetical protein